MIAERTKTNLAAAREIVKDTTSLDAQSRWFTAQAIQAREIARRTRRMRLLGKSDGMAALAEQAGPALSLSALSQSVYDGARDFAGAGCMTTSACPWPAVSSVPVGIRPAFRTEGSHASSSMEICAI